jgi:(E)-4-hydroxy-3-methylbut-2-enyl-diphosphate synthase
MIETISKFKEYCNSLTKYSRYKTREVSIGNIPLGNNNPIRIQSMTITNTMDTKATVEQTIRIVKSGCDYVRITAPSKLEAQNLENVKKELKARGYDVPLIADIHFTPNAAEIAARIVEKVRVNPGNYADRKKFEIVEYTDDKYEAELERIRKKFTPLVMICKEYGTAMRIGTNHGSLSDRIMNRYGDTPLGMVESALEFVRICEDLDYHEIVLSMKASNPQVMVQAYRLLVQRMNEEKMNYPLHLGVTEAGAGEDGRIKSAVGIGTLLEDGLGDTIRVSLTEDPEYEAPVAILLADRYRNRANHKQIKPIEEPPFNPYEYEKRISIQTGRIGESNVTKVVADYSKRKINDFKDLSDIGYFYNTETDKWNMSDTAADLLYLGSQIIPFNIPNGLQAIYDYNSWLKLKEKSSAYPLCTAREFLNSDHDKNLLKFVSADLNSLTTEFVNKIKNDNNLVLIVTTENEHGMAEQRRVFFELMNNEINNSVIIKRSYNNLSVDQFRLFASTDLGSLLIDGYGDGVWVEIQDNFLTVQSDGKYIRKFTKEESKEKIINRTLFGILQAARVRISKTEYIACPSCGRTLFDLQETTEMIRKKTEHLKGVKIAIMGCIVNGPGEMADADYGYVGSGVGKITLYRKKDIVRRNIPTSEAVDALIGLIKEDGKWVEI